MKESGLFTSKRVLKDAEVNQLMSMLVILSTSLSGLFAVKSTYNSIMVPTAAAINFPSKTTRNPNVPPKTSFYWTASLEKIPTQEIHAC